MSNVRTKRSNRSKIAAPISSKREILCSDKQGWSSSLLSPRKVWSIFSRYNYFFMPSSLLVCTRLRSTSSFLASESLFYSQLTLIHEAGGNMCRRKAGYTFFWTTERSTPPASDLPSHLSVRPFDTGYIIFETACMYINKQSIIIDSVELCMWSGWRGGAGKPGNYHV